MRQKLGLFAVHTFFNTLGALDVLVVLLAVGKHIADLTVLR